MHWTEQLLAIGFVFVLLGAAVWLLSRKRGGFDWPRIGRTASQSDLVRCLARLPLTSQHMLHLVKAGERTILITTYPGGAVIDSHAPSFPLSLANALEQESGK